MKSRLLIRALCVGAALLVPAGGLTGLAAGTAGAATKTTVATSTAKPGTLATATLKGITCNLAVAITCTISKQGSITKSGDIIGAVLLAAKLKITVNTATTTISTAKITTLSFTIKGATISPTCKVTTTKTAIFTGSGLVLTDAGTAITAASITVTSTPGTGCTTAQMSTLKTQISSTNLTSTITF